MDVVSDAGDVRNSHGRLSARPNARRGKHGRANEAQPSEGTSMPGGRVEAQRLKGNAPQPQPRASVSESGAKRPIASPTTPKIPLDGGQLWHHATV